MAKTWTVVGAYVREVRIVPNSVEHVYDPRGQVTGQRYHTGIVLTFDLRTDTGDVLAEHPNVHGEVELPDGTTAKETPWTWAEIVASLPTVCADLAALGKRQLADFP